MLLLNPFDSSLVRGVITNDVGDFILEEIPAANYLLHLSYVGYEGKYEPVDLRANLDLGVLMLSPTSSALDEVVVKAKKPLYELAIDRMVINVQSSITSAGGNALEVLEKSPGVILDRSRNQLSLVGKQGVLIMINGKRARQPISAIIQMLEGMNAENIEKIELITNPPARYEAGGNGGIINIVMVKRADLGTNGNYSITLGYGMEDKQGASLNLNHRNESVNWYGNFSFNRNHEWQRFTNERTVNEFEQVFETRTVSERDPISTNLNGRVGMDYSLSKKTTLGAFINAYSNKWDMTAVNSGFETLDGQTTQYNIGITEVNHWKSLMSNVNLAHKIEGGDLTFDIDYIRYHQDNPSTYLNRFEDAENQLLDEENIQASKDTPVEVWVSRIDFSKNLNDKLKFSAGIKGIMSDLSNEVMVENESSGRFAIDESLSENARLKEQIGALYTALDINFSENTKLNLGLRYEYTDANLSTATQQNLVDQTYGSLFPTLFLLQKIDENWSLQGSYGRRIYRPTYNDLAPFVFFMDPTTYFFGNTQLQPAFSNNYKVDVRCRLRQMSHIHI